MTTEVPPTPQPVRTASMRVRSAVPDALAPAVIKARVWRKRRKEAPIAKARAHMSFLLGAIKTPEEVEKAAQAYLAYDVVRSELRYHPKLIGHQEVENVGALKQARKAGRGVVVSFLHHGHYEGACASIGFADDQPLHVIVSPEMLAPDAPTFLRQHVIAGTIAGSPAVSAAVGAQGMLGLLAAGSTIALATDVPGRTQLPFLGQERLGSSGAARIAHAAGSPVIALTAHRTDGVLSLRMSDPIPPGDFASADDLLRHLMALQEPAILAWPEGYHQPLLRWGAVEGTPAAAIATSAGHIEES